ncbi:MAG: TRAP transporter small permease subunit [Desulforhopalus sp.]|nr:TRAP transporter small permease subunit [Desulforhopalus sp.]
MIEPGRLFPTHPVLRLLDKGESVILSLLLAAMILLACLQIILRTFFASGLFWADPLLRYLVLWCGLLGAVSATGQGKHIALDITGNYLPKKIDPWVTLITHLFCTLASAGLTWAGWRFLLSEIEFGGSGPLSLPLWFWNSIFPIAFGLITLKYLLLLLVQIKILFTPSLQAAGN